MLVVLALTAFILPLVEIVDSMFLLTSNCLPSSPSCDCLWKGGKFVANCSGQGLTKVPKVSPVVA